MLLGFIGIYHNRGKMSTPFTSNDSLLNDPFSTLNLGTNKRSDDTPSHVLLLFPNQDKVGRICSSTANVWLLRMDGQ